MGLHCFLVRQEIWKEKVLGNLETRSDYLGEHYVLVMQITLSSSSDLFHFVVEKREHAQLQTLISNYLLDISAGISNRHITLVRSRTKLLWGFFLFLSWICPFYPSSVNDSFILPFPWLKIIPHPISQQILPLYVLKSSSFSPWPLQLYSFNPLWSLFCV